MIKSSPTSSPRSASSFDGYRLADLLNILTVLGLLAGAAAIFKQTRITDFPVDMAVYREGVRAFLAGEPVYSVPMHVGDLELPFIYPPFGALIMSPLVLIPGINDDLAGNIMIRLSGVLLLGCLYFTARAVFPRRYGLVLAAVCWPLVLMMEPVWLNAGFAQINIVIMSLVVFDLVPRRRWLPQGSLIGIAAAIKLTPLAMLLFFLLRKDFRAIITAGVSAVLMTAVAALVRFDATKEYFSTVIFGLGTKADFGVDTAYTSNSSLKGMLMRWHLSEDAMLHSSWLAPVWLILVIGTIIGGALIMWALLKCGLEVEAWLVNAVVMLLISPVSWSHHWVWLALVLPVAAAWAVHLKNWVMIGIVALWACWVLREPPKWWYGDGNSGYFLNFWQKILVSDFTWLALALLVTIAWALWSARGERSRGEGSRGEGSRRQHDTHAASNA